jgi:hypothetical protein
MSQFDGSHQRWTPSAYRLTRLAVLWATRLSDAGCHYFYSMIKTRGSYDVDLKPSLWHHRRLSPFFLRRPSAEPEYFRFQRISP